MTSQEFAIRRLTVEIECLDVTRESARIALAEYESWQADDPSVIRWQVIIDRNADIRASLALELEWVRNNSILVLAGDDVVKLRHLAVSFDHLRNYFATMHECFQRPAPSEAAGWEKFRTKAVADLGVLIDMMRGIAGDLQAMFNRETQSPTEGK